MRQITFILTNKEKINFNTSLTSFVLNQEQPFGIEYRKKCSSTLSETQINEWWNYVDSLLIERPTTNFHSVWKIEDNGVLYGYEN